MFVDRRDAGRRLGLALRRELGIHPGRRDVIVAGLPRGGVVVASEVAAALGARLDVIVVRKLGVPGQPELAFGAIGEGGARVLNNGVATSLGLTSAGMRNVEMRERLELGLRIDRFRGERPRVPMTGKTIVIVDDGVATGATARAACAIARADGASRVVLATPVAPFGWEHRLADAADEYVALETPETVLAIGRFYDDFKQTTDEEVVACLRNAETLAAGFEDDVEIDLGPVRLHGHLAVPERSPGVVVFAHGSGSSRHSLRNVFVATELRRAGLGTLLFDLLTNAEERDRRNVFDVELLAERLVAVTIWLRSRPELADQSRIGYFGASTGAAAALWAAADRRVSVAAVVSRGGRPDLAGARLPLVGAPTLLIVGGEDREVLALNQQAADRMACPNQIWVVPGATHLFSEPGALETVADLARAWFTDYLVNERADVTGRE